MSRSKDPGIIKENISRFPVVGVGASAGGLDAFRQFVQALPRDTGMAFIFIQHLDAAYESTLSAILQRETKMPVVDLQAELWLEADHIYVLPSNKILAIHDNVLQLKDKPAKDLQPLHSIDIFFSALAEIFQSQAIGILLSGMGSDGTIGLKKIKDYGGVTFAQSVKSASYASMPQHALEADVVDFDLSPSEMPQQLLKINETLRIVPPSEDYLPGPVAEENYFKQVLSLLRTRKDVDFTYYKQTTIRRRILRRMLVNKADSLGGYLAILKKSTAEQDILYQDLLIPVTAFFRDPAIFDGLCTKVLPAVFANKPAATPVRLWVAACSTGEEAYSLAMCLHEYLGDRISGMKLQLFATDLSEKAIQKARLGLYSKRDIEGVSPERLQAYFTKVDGHYQVKKVIRDLCVFAVHNFLKDPPFAKIDFISCRNVLIYLDSYLQKKALGTFHYALNEKGILLLGKSETAGNAGTQFRLVGKHEKIYERKPSPGRNTSILPERVEKTPAAAAPRAAGNNRKEDFHKNADDVLLAKYTPAGVVVNEQAEIVQFRGLTGAFLEAAPGKASLSILKMAREGLAFEIRNALHKAKETKKTVVKKDIPLHSGNRLVTIEVVPLQQTIEPHYLVLFSEGQPAGQAEKGKGKIDPNPASLKRIQQLEKELAELREDMRAITEDQEAANEELQSANEELLSGSEELQSLNEELETSKEELQSTNEELMTMNQELYERNEQYNQSRLYAEAIVSTIREPLLVLNRDLRVKSANQSFYDEFKLKEGDIAGRILFELQGSSWDIPELRTQLLKIQTGQLPQMEWEVEFSLPGARKKNIVLNARPVNALDSEQMILLAFEDVTLFKKEAKRLLEVTKEMEKELKLMEVFFTQLPALFCILKGPRHVFDFVNPRFKEITGPGMLEGKPFAAVFPGNPEITALLDEVYRTGEPFYGKEMRAMQFASNDAQKEISIDLSCQTYRNSDNSIEGILFFGYDVTEKVKSRLQVENNTLNLEHMVEERTAMLLATNKALELSNRNLQEFASIASHDLQEPLRKIRTFTNMLTDFHRQDIAPEARELLMKTKDAATRMSALVRDILNYSTITQPGKSFSMVDLNAVFSDVVKEFDLLAEEKEAKISFQHLPTVEAEPSQMKQLLHNLLSNALKFSFPGRKPVIELFCKQLDQNEIETQEGLHPSMAYWQLRLVDNGIGFEQQFAEQVFSIFERLNPAEHYEGTGIGLALCLKIVTFHNGLIRAEAKEHEGTAMYIILPGRQPLAQLNR